MGRTEKYKFGLAKEKRLAQLLTELDWSAEDHTLAEELLGTLSCLQANSAPSQSWWTLINPSTRRIVTNRGSICNLH